MVPTPLKRKFEAMGARIKLRDLPRRTNPLDARRYVIDIQRDKRGEFFDIASSPNAGVTF